MNITYYSLSDYSAGDLHSFTLDPSLYSDEEAFTDAIQSELDELTLSLDDGELREEYIIADYEDIPSVYIGVYEVEPDLWEYIDLLSELDVGVVNAGLDCGIPLSDISNAYYGQYEDDEALAYEQFMEMEINDTWYTSYIDFERMGRDVAMDYSESDGYYFSNNY